MDTRDSQPDSDPNQTQNDSNVKGHSGSHNTEGRVKLVRRAFLRAGAVAVGMLPFGGIGTAAASIDLDDITGFHPPQIDGHPYGHSGDSLPGGKEGEWADARATSVELVQPGEGRDLPATLFTKVVEGNLFLAIHVPPQEGETAETLRSATLARFRLQLDRGGSGELSPGDIRVIGRPRTRSGEPVELDPADGILSVQWQLEVFDGEMFVPREVESSPASMMARSSDENGFGVEARIDLRAVDEILHDDSTEEGELGFSLDLQFEEILYGVGASPDEVYDESVYGGRYGPPTAPVLPEDTSSVERLEVTQSTQDANNSQELVKDKETLARVFVDHPEPRPITVDVTLKATTLQSGTWITLGELSQEFEAPPTPTDREERDHSANFELPASWRAQNFILVTAKVTRPGHIVTSTAPRSDSARFTPVDTYNPNILFIRVNEGTAEDPDLPSKRAARLTKDAFRRMMPITDPWFITLGSGTLGPIEDDDNLIAELDEIAETFRTGFTFGTPIDQIFGQTQNYGGGLSDPVWGGGGPSNHFATWGELGSSSRELVMAHEINHNIGGKRWAFHVAGCGSGGGDSNFPHSNTDTNEVGWNPASSDMVPASRGELMTYCGTWRNPSKWIGPYRWDHLIGRFHGWIPEQPVHQDFLPQVSSSLTVQADGGVHEAPPTARVITGFLGKDGGGELRPSFEFPGETDDPDPEVSDPRAVLRIKRESETVHIDIGASFEPLEQETVDRSAFSFSVPDNGTIEDIQLLDTDKNVLDEFTNYEPEGVEATMEIPLEFERDELYTLNIDIPAESDVVTFYRRLLYSPDGENWLPFGPTFTDDTYPVRFTEEPGGKRAQFMLLISDGVRTKRVKSEPFTVPSRPPEVRIDRAHRWVAEVEGEEDDTSGNDDNGGRGRRDAQADVEIDEIYNAADPIETVVGATVSVRGVGLDERGIELPPDWLFWEVMTEDGAPVQVTGSAKGNRFVHQFGQTGTYTVRVRGHDRRIERSATDEIVVEVSEPPLPPTRAVKAFTRTRDR